MAGLNNLPQLSAVVIPQGPEELMTTLMDFAETSITAASTAVDNLTAYPSPVLQGNAQYSPVNIQVPYITDLSSLSLPVDATDFTDFSEELNLIELDSPDPITVPTEPTFNLESQDIETPTLVDPIAPVAPELGTIPDFPQDVSLNPVSPPSLLGLIIPGTPIIEIPEFNIADPLALDLEVPSDPFTWTEDVYSDPLLDKVKALLSKRLDGGTGLDPDVEYAIWNRGRDRESVSLASSERALFKDNASRGFTVPTGYMMSAIVELNKTYQGKLIELSREIMIKQADLEQTNLREAISQTTSLEAQLMDALNKVNQRLFEAAKYTREFLLEVFKIELSKYQTSVEVYKTLVQTYLAKLDIQKTRVEIYKAQLSGEELKQELNKDSIEIYKAQNEANSVLLDQFKTKVDVTAKKIDSRRLILDQYKTDVDAYTSLINANTQRVNMYSEQVRAQATILQKEGVKAEVFSNRIKAYAAQVDAEKVRTDAAININDSNVKAYLAKADTYSTNAKIKAAKYQADVDLYKSRSAALIAKLEAESQMAKIGLAANELQITQAKSTVDVALANAKLTADAALQTYGIAIESRKAAGTIHSSLASSALNAIHVTSSTSSSASISASEDHNYTDN